MALALGSCLNFLMGRLPSPRTEPPFCSFGPFCRSHHFVFFFVSTVSWAVLFVFLLSAIVSFGLFANPVSKPSPEAFRCSLCYNFFQPADFSPFYGIFFEKFSIGYFYFLNSVFPFAFLALWGLFFPAFGSPMTLPRVAVASFLCFVILYLRPQCTFFFLFCEVASFFGTFPRLLFSSLVFFPFFLLRFPFS